MLENGHVWSAAATLARLVAVSRELQMQPLESDKPVSRAVTALQEALPACSAGHVGLAECLRCQLLWSFPAGTAMVDGDPRLASTKPCHLPALPPLRSRAAHAFWQEQKGMQQNNAREENWYCSTSDNHTRAKS